MKTSIEAKHICVCICTYNRSKLLERLLLKLETQNTYDLFTYSVVVVDNDINKSAEAMVQMFLEFSELDLIYITEPVQNIALARNKAVASSKGDFIAFIDDDEFPDSDWLANLFKAYKKFNVDGILGPVLPYYRKEPPEWIKKGKFHERPSHKTGTILPWRNTRTGNVLLRRDIFKNKENLFRSEFGSGGEDRDFFKRMISQGHQFVWSAESSVYEEVPPERCKKAFLLKRALLRGKTPYNQNIIGCSKSIIAIPIYTLLLPFMFFLGDHVFIKYLIKYFDHIGRISFLLGVNVVKDKYIFE